MKTLTNFTKERGIVLFLALFLSTTLGDKMSSHPSVYVFNGEKYVVQGELYSGMIGENLANYEYFPLPALQAQAGNFQLRISNESNGQQYTDMAQLLVVQHPQNKEAIMDQRGKAHLIGKAQKPITVTSSNGSDLSLATGAKDDQVFAFDNEDFSRNAVILKFKKPERTERGKLILRAQSSEWMAQVIDSYYRKFGKDFPNWLQEQNALSSPERLQGMRDNDLPLSVYLKRDGEWELMEYFVATTPLQARDLVIPLNLMTIKDTELEMKVETGFKFWDLDYAAMDFTPNGQVTTTFIQASSALDQDKNNTLARLTDADLKYVVLKKTGDYIELLYPESAVANGGGANTFFLYTKGYSEMNVRFEGAPAVNELKTLKEPGALSDYSKMEYLKRKAEGKVSSM